MGQKHCSFSILNRTNLTHTSTTCMIVFQKPVQELGEGCGSVFLTVGLDSLQIHVMQNRSSSKSPKYLQWLP